MDIRSLQAVRGRRQGLGTWLGGSEGRNGDHDDHAGLIKTMGLGDRLTVLFTATVMEEDCDGLCWLYLMNVEKAHPDTGRHHRADEHEHLSAVTADAWRSV